MAVVIFMSYLNGCSISEESKAMPCYQENVDIVSIETWTYKNPETFFVEGQWRDSAVHLYGITCEAIAKKEVGSEFTRPRLPPSASGRAGVSINDSVMAELPDKKIPELKDLLDYVSEHLDGADKETVP